MYRKILVPIDGSPVSNRALGEAIELAKNQSAEILLIHVVDEWKVASGDIAGVNLAAGAQQLAETGRALLRDTEARVRQAGLSARTVLVEGIGVPVGASIVQRAREWPADLIVCGTHGRRGLARVLMGSNAEYIVRHTPVPVLLVRTPGNGDTA